MSSIHRYQLVPRPNAIQFPARHVKLIQHAHYVRMVTSFQVNLAYNAPIPAKNVLAIYVKVVLLVTIFTKIPVTLALPTALLAQTIKLVPFVMRVIQLPMKTLLQNAKNTRQRAVHYQKCYLLYCQPYFQ